MWTLSIRWRWNLWDPVKADLVKSVDIDDKVNDVDLLDNVDMWTC